MKELKNMGKTNTISIDNQTITQNDTLKPSIKSDHVIKHSSIKIENISQSFNYSKIDEIQQCNRLSG